MSNCGKCHTCGTILRSVLDGEEYCDTCGRYQRYRSHGWAAVSGEESPCPGTEHEMPLYIHSDLMACFKFRESTKYPGFFPVWKDRANEWLIKHIGIFTDNEPIFTKLNNAFTVVFDWHIQRFCIGIGEPK